MDRKNDLELSRAVLWYTERAEELGLVVTQEFEFELLEELCARENVHQVSEQFSTRYFDFTPDNAFWVCVTDQEGDFVSCQAVRVDRIKGISLQDHWRQQQRRIYVDPYPDQKPQLGDRHPAPVQRISGLVAYHGEMWLSKKWRGMNLGGPLCRLGQLLAYQRWELDYIYCFISRSLIHKGFGADQGYAHFAPIGTEWITTPHHIRNDDLLCWNTPEDLRRLAWATIQLA